ncbi:MAG: Ig-like domain-containing protein [Verrucomicrobiales bacterium]
MKKSRSFLLPCIASLALPAFQPVAMAADDASFIAVAKIQSFAQYNAIIPSLIDEEDDDGRKPISFEIFVQGTSAGSITSGSFTGPGSVASGSMTEDGQRWFFEQDFDKKPQLDSSFPSSGDYVISVEGENDGSQSVTLSFAGDDYPNVPFITNFEALQALDASAAITLQWDPFQSGSADDHISLYIEKEHSPDGGTVYEAPNPGEPGALDGTSTSLTLPPGTLDPGSDYTVQIGFYRIGTPDTSYVEAVPAFGKQTRFPLETVAVTDTQEPSLRESSPSYAASGISDNSVIMFRFDEPMNQDVDFSQAISWSGVDPAKFSYSWSSSGRRLFCDYSGSLPLDATVAWTLNPTTGSSGPPATRLEDLAGNPLRNAPRSGEFTTASTSSAGQPDVAWYYLIKARYFNQDASSTTSGEDYNVHVGFGLNGLNTVFPVELTVPGASAPVEMDGRGGGSGQEESASYVEQSDLDAFLANGSYTFRFNSFNDSPRTVTLDVSPESYPDPPVIQDYAALQAIDSTQDLTLRWDAVPGPGADDYIVVFVSNSEDREVFFTPLLGQVGDVVSEPLPATATSVVMPAGTLPPGRSLELNVAFVSVSDKDTVSYPGATGSAGFATVTSMAIQTGGDAIVPRLDMLQVTGSGQMQFRVVGEAGLSYTIESSEDLINWTAEYSESADSEDGSGLTGYFSYTAQGNTQSTARFYRVREGDTFSSGGD